MQAIRKLLSAYRTEIKAIAILWVVLFHADLGLKGVLFDIKMMGFGGVDIFLFMSGFGLFYSLEQSCELGDYMRRRARRLLPAYLPFCLIWLMVMIPLKDLGLARGMKTATGNLFMIALYGNAPVYINWYPAVLLLTLLLAPYFYALLKGDACFEKRALMLFAGSLLTGMAFISSELNVVFSRLPVFVLGMIFAGWRNDKPKTAVIGGGLLVGCAVGTAAFWFFYTRYHDLLSEYALWWYPFVLIAPAVCVGAAWFFSKCSSRMLAPLRVVGRASFEIFLFNAWVEYLGKYHGLCKTHSDWLFWSLASIAAGLLYHLVVKKTVQIFSKKAEKRG